MYIIGITGGTGAGKTSAMNALQSFGAILLDCDEIYHEMLLSNADMKSEIEARFENVTTGGEIDRSKLGNIVWNDPSALQDLNTITHRHINSEIEWRVISYKEQGGNLAAVDAIALIESGQSHKCDVVIGITAPLGKRISRIMERDGLSEEQALIRINAQKPESFYKENCDHILENTYDSQDEFESKCKEFFSALLIGRGHMDRL